MLKPATARKRGLIHSIIKQPIIRANFPGSTCLTRTFANHLPNDFHENYFVFTGFSLGRLQPGVEI